MYTSLSVEKKDHVAEVTLLGPGKGNAMGPDFWREMPRAFTALDEDESVRAIVLKGSGKHFSFGLDLQGMMGDLGPLMGGENLAYERGKLHKLILSFQEATTCVARCRKPVIAAISGWCIGGGLDLISACDVRLCSSDAMFSLREVKLAIIADVGSLQRLPFIIGQAAVRELAFTGKDIDAQRALRMGLVSDVFENQDAVFSAARRMATEIAGNPPLTVQGIKQVLNESVEDQIAKGLRYVASVNASQLQSKDLMEAMGAFMEKRTPKFSGT